nr:hypothetical protein [Tanacetum cinerariifolium]
MSPKRTAWNEFSSSMASAVICLATSRKFNFSKYIFDSLVRNVDSPSKFYMYPRFLQLMINAQIADLSSHTTKYQIPIPCPNKKVFANMRRVGKGFSRVDTLLLDGMLVPQQVQDDIDATVAATPPPLPHQSPIDLPSSPPQQQPSKPLQTTDISMDLLNTLLETWKIAELDADEDVTLEEVDAEKDAAVQGRLPESQAQGVIIHDPEEIATPSFIGHSEPTSKDKRKRVLVEEPKPLKRQAHIEQDEAYARELEVELNANINWNEVIEQVKRKEKQDNTVMIYQSLKRNPVTEAHVTKNMMHVNYIMAFLEKGEDELEEEASKQGKKKSESCEQQAAKKQRIDEEVEELKTHLQIVPNDEDDVYTEATPLALKVLVVHYQIHTEHNKPYTNLKPDGTHRLFLSFISLLRNFDRKDLEMLWKNIQERFASSELKNFSDDFLLNALKTMFEKPNVEDSIWKNQRGRYGLAKIKSWKLLKSCGVHIITFITTQIILLVERRYPLTRFTLDQIFNNVRLEVKEESKVSLELLRFVRRQQQEGYRLE